MVLWTGTLDESIAVSEVTRSGEAKPHFNSSSALKELFCTQRTFVRGSHRMLQASRTSDLKYVHKAASPVAQTFRACRREPHALVSSPDNAELENKNAPNWTGSYTRTNTIIWTFLNTWPRPCANLGRRPLSSMSTINASIRCHQNQTPSTQRMRQSGSTRSAGARSDHRT